MYDIRHIDVSVRCVFTNTVPTAPYRGAGRPEANYVLERLVDEAARVTGIDPVELRRRNLIPRVRHAVQDRGRHHLSTAAISTPMLDKALALADYDGFKRASAKRQRRGKYRGIGISCMLEHAGGTPTRRRAADVSRRRHAVGRAQRAVDRPGPRLVFPRLAAERLGIAAEQGRATGTAIPAWRSPATRRSARARRSPPARSIVKMHRR